MPRPKKPAEPEMPRMALSANWLAKDWRRDFVRGWPRLSEYEPGQSLEPAADFIVSSGWLKLRYQVLKSFGARCQCCGATKDDGVRIDVDHIKPRSLYPELALDFANLQVLCGPCNLGKSNRDSTNWRENAWYDGDFW